MPQQRDANLAALLRLNLMLGFDEATGLAGTGTIGERVPVDTGAG